MRPKEISSKEVVKVAKLSGRRVLVAGGSGFLGSHLCRFLISHGSEVHAMSRNQLGRATGELHWWEGDLADIHTARKLLSTIKPDVIFHLTTHGWGGPGLEHVLPTLHSDLNTTVSLLTAATERQVPRLVLTGSLEEPQVGDAEVVPSSPYAAAKWASGAYARMFHQLYGTPLVILRIFMGYGPGQPVKKLIPYVILSMLKKESPTILNAQRQIDWIYVDDVVDGLVAAATASNVEGRTIDLGTGRLVSIKEIVQRLGRLINATQPLLGVIKEGPVTQARTADTREAYTKLRWKAKVSLEKGLQETVDWYRNEWKHYESEDCPQVSLAKGH